MKFFTHSLATPELNLAYEEWLFNSFNEEVLRLWINPPSVIVGKHQNAAAEANIQHCRQFSVPVLRRISGGGTVFHDLGNINFSFFRFIEKDKMIDYDRNLNLVKLALNKLGYPVTMNERHDLYLGQAKVSGNAQHLKKGKALHHGTILYDADRALLRSVITRESGHFEDKGVKSVRSEITNLRPHLDLGDTTAFLARMEEVLIKLGMKRILPLTPTPSVLSDLIRERYSEESWNFGYSPKYTFTNESPDYSVKMEVERGGRITSGMIQGKNPNNKDFQWNLEGLYHFPMILSEKIAASDVLMHRRDALMGVLF